MNLIRRDAGARLAYGRQSRLVLQFVGVFVGAAAVPPFTVSNSLSCRMRTVFVLSWILLAVVFFISRSDSHE
jgi:hypothetical protein